MKNYPMTLEEIKDLSVLIVGDLVLNGLVKDCTDTDDEIEFEFQDVIVETLCQKFKVKMEVTTQQVGQLYILIPLEIVQHFADQKKVSAFDICEMIVEQNPAWVNRLLDNETSYCLNDLNHDFVGLMANDEHFVPRI